MRNLTIPHRLCHFQMCKYIRSLGCQQLPRSIGMKKRSLATRAPEQAGTDTPEARRGTAPINNIADSSDVVNTENKDYSLRYDETEFNARRELSSALLTVAQTDAERKSLESYQKMVKTLNEQEELLGQLKDAALVN